MICVSKEYEIKTKIVQEQSLATAKNDVFIFLLGRLDFWWEGTKIWWGGGE